MRGRDTSFSRQILGGSFVITVAGVGARLLAVLTVPVLSPLLGPEPYGIAALVGTTVSIASVLALLGIDMGYARYFLAGDETERARTERFCWRFAAVGASASALLVGSGWYGLGARWSDSHEAIAFYVVVAIISSVASTMATTRTRLRGDYQRVGLAIFATSILSAAVSIGIAVLWRPDAWALFVGTAAASIGTIVILGMPSKAQFLSPSGLVPERRNAIVSLGIAGGVTAPLYWLISSADRWFIGSFSGVAITGIYSMASSVALLGQMLNTSVTLVWFPEVSRFYSEQADASLEPIGRIWSRLTTALAIVWIAIAAAGGDILRLLAAPVFHSGAAYIPWLAGGVFFYGLASLANTQLFLAGQMRYTAYCWAGGAVICLLLNVMLVPRLGAQGAAMAQCGTFMVIASGILVVSHRTMPMPVRWSRLSAVLFIAVISGVLLSPPWASFPLVSLAFKLPVGFIIALVLAWLIADDWVRLVLRNVAKVSPR